MNESEAAVAIQVITIAPTVLKTLLDGLQVLLHHHATQDPVPTPQSKAAATAVLDQLPAIRKQMETPVDIETGKGPLPTS